MIALLFQQKVRGKKGKVKEMAKREYILREEALSHPFANGKYDHKNANKDFILGHESYKEWLEALPATTEQEIVKPYLEKLKEQVSHCNLCLLVRKEDVLGFIDNLLSESEVK